MTIFPHFGARPPHAAERHDDAASPSSGVVVPKPSTPSPGRVDTAGAGEVPAPATPFLSILAAQLAYAHNHGPTVQDCADAACAARGRGDVECALWFEARGRVIKRGRLL